MPGFLLINKPAGPTSHDIVDRVRRMAGVKTVGHAGTLDPFASGLLIVGVGREATREFVKLVGLDKRYIATLHLGGTSDTDDRTGVISYGQHTMDNEQFLSRPDGTGVVHRPLSIVHNDHETLTKETILQVLKRFSGKIQQLPPVYSAKKIKGKKMYQLAREGKTFERQPVEVEIYSIVAETYNPQPTTYNLVLNIHCSSGTYIRALARDIGETLGCGSYLEELERTAIGPFTLKETVKADELNTGNWEEHLSAVEDVLKRIENYPRTVN